MSKQTAADIQTNQQGFASIVVALIFLLVLGLLSVGFAVYANNEQQNTLSRQLGVEAQYAAESAINNAEQDIADGKITPANASSSSCMPTSSLTGSDSANDTTLNSSDGIQVSCLLVNLNPPDLVNDGVAPGSEWSQQFTASAPLTGTNALKISWGSSDGNYNYDPNINDVTNRNLFDNASWKTGSTSRWAPLLQVSITPLGAGGGSNRTALLNDALNFYLYPTSDTSKPNSINYTSGIGLFQSSPAADASNTNGSTIPGNCNASATGAAGTTACSATITGLDLGTSFMGPYLITFIPYYDSADILLSAGGSSQNVNFTGQDQIDATARAHNTVKRLVVTIPSRLSATPTIPAFQIQSRDLCKHFTTYPNDAGTDYPLPASGDPDNVCNLD